MRASSAPRPPAAAPAALLVVLLAALLPLGALSAQAGPAPRPQPLEPAFRLPAGGRALAGPLVEAGKPASAWYLSEDGALYVITEGGALSARIPLGGKAAPYLALDPFGRALVLAGGRLEAATKSGTIAYSLTLPRTPADPPAFGSDGRAFIALGSELICCNPAGRRLWTVSLPAAASSPPAVDPAGRPAVGLADGRVLVLTPYGETLFEARGRGSPSPVRLIAPMAPSSGDSAGLPSLAAALADGSLLLVGPEGELRASIAPRGSPIVDLFWDGALLYSLDASGRLSALSAAGSPVWSAETRCPEGRIFLFEERIVAAGKGRAVSLSLEGQVYREISIANSAGRAAVAPGGLVFAPGEDWILAAYRFEAPLGKRREALPEPYPELEAAASAMADELILYDPAVGDVDRQLTRLDDIEKSVRSGSIGKDEPEAAAFCALLASGRLDREYPQAERRFRANPLPRSRACAILGALGSTGYRAALAAVLSGDADVAVRAAACDALADIGVDPGGSSAAAFLAAARAPADERTALGLIAAIERMALRSGTAPGLDAVATLLALASKPYGNTVRGRASAALGRIAGAVDR